ncbi:hypothetical protein Tco_0124857, partial [Tanacetum coccineum]
MAAPITTATPSPRTTTPKPPSSPSPHHHPAATPPRCHAIPIIIIIIPSPSSGGDVGYSFNTTRGVVSVDYRHHGGVGLAVNSRGQPRVFVSLGLHSNKGAYGFVISTKEGALGLKPPQHHLG